MKLECVLDSSSIVLQALLASRIGLLPMALRLIPSMLRRLSVLSLYTMGYAPRRTT